MMNSITAGINATGVISPYHYETATSPFDTSGDDNGDTDADGSTDASHLLHHRR